jgi:transcriptional regulator with XRE-family HTH domain
MTPQEIGDKVRTQRALRGWGQAELAQRLGTSVPTISRLENGLYDVTFKELLALAQIFQMSLPVFVESPRAPASSNDSALLLLLMQASSRLPRPVLRRLVALAKAVERACTSACGHNSKLIHKKVKADQ